MTNEEIRLLAKQEREMDSGEQPYVTYCGDRVGVKKEMMEELGLHQKQTINSIIFRKILELRLESIAKRIDQRELEQIKPSDFKID